ncbi:MAG: RIO1 family regulatory kinase/ATPase, partial [Nanoarchaeota archaeon]
MNLSNLKLIQHGAEAKIFLDEKSNLIIKDRVSKSYRLPALDNKLTKQRTKAEKKLLEKASKIINAPDPFPLKEINIINMPFIDGEKLSDSLNDFSLEKQKQIMIKIGESVSKLHKEDIIHGDLTTSNMILVYGSKKGNIINCNSKDNRNNNYHENNKADDDNVKGDNNSQVKIINSKEISRHEVSANAPDCGREGWDDFSVYFIDFGLGYISKKVEDKAVDLHLLKQALEAKHFQHWKVLFEEFQKAYSKNYPDSKQIFERITAVERRGRYR